MPTLYQRLRYFCPALSDGKGFTKLDLSHAYLQVLLGEECKPLTTINTQRVVHVQLSSIWNIIFTSHLSEGYG